MKTLLFLLLMVHLWGRAQTVNCTFKPPAVTINFGTGNVGDLNASGTAAYTRVGSTCPSDGHYTYTPFTSDCFRGDWITMNEDHTPGDASGNMMIVNASYRNGYFLSTVVNGLKGNTTYKFSVWMTNVCKLSDKCPFPLLPDISIRLQTQTGKLVAQLETGELIRRLSPQWTEYTMMFTTPASDAGLVMTMIDNVPGGCGNDFALDDITFRECVKVPPPTARKPVAPSKKNVTQPALKPKVSEPQQKSKEVATKPLPKSKVPPAEATATTKQPTAAGPGGNAATAKRSPTRQTTVKAKKPDTLVTRLPSTLPKPTVPVLTPRAPKFVAPPPVLTRRSNTLFKQIETEAGEIVINLYDNGEIDGDTVTIYHNNVLVVSKARLSQKPVTFRITIDPANPHHELVMVAENLGSIPPNTSLMVVTAGSKRFEVFTSATEERNAKVVFDLKE